MEPEADTPFEPNDEVDELRWLTPRTPPTALTYPHDAGLVRAAVERLREPRALPRPRRRGWTRLDGPAGTQMVDAAIEAMADWMRSGRGANQGGAFAAAHATDELVAAARASAGGAARRRRRARSSSAPA